VRPDRQEGRDLPDAAPTPAPGSAVARSSPSGVLGRRSIVNLHYGSKAQVADNPDGVVLDYQLKVGNFLRAK